MSLNSKLYKNPLSELSSTDTGDDTQRRFRYQHTCTAYLACLMYLGRLPYQEIYCELHEDILCLCENGKFQGIQIKSRELHLGPFNLEDEAVIKSLKRFLIMNRDYKNHFEKFIFICNCDYLKDNTGKSILTLEKQIKSITSKSHTFSPNTLEKFISNLEIEYKYTRPDMIDFLNKLEFQVMSNIDDISSVIIDKIIPEIEHLKNANVSKLHVVLDNLINTIYYASSKYSNDTIKNYISLLNGNRFDNLTDAEVNEKRITKAMIDKITKKEGSKQFYLSDNLPIKLKPNRKIRMERKMNCGAIDPDIIDCMNELREKSEEYFFEDYYKNGVNNNETQKKLSHLITMVKTQSLEAKSIAKKKCTPYGEIMLTDIEERLQSLTINRKDDIDGCPYEILKGLIGMITGECKLEFSEKPVGGWGDDDAINS